MGKLQGILSMPFSRKFIAAVLVPLLAWLNSKFNVGLSDAELIAYAAATVAYILGTAHEDAAATKAEAGKDDDTDPSKPASGATITRMPAVIVLVGALLMLPIACRGWPEMNQDVKKLRAIHKVYHEHTVAKEPTRTADVEALYQKEDSILEHMDELTR